MKVLFVYPEHYLCVGIPGGIAVLSAVLKNLGHEVELFDTAFLKTQKYYDAEKIHQAVHGGGGGTSDKGGIAVYKSTEYTIEDLVKDDPLVDVIEVFQAKIDAFEPDVIALSCMTSIFDYACSLVKAVTHDAVVVVGGVHATIAADDCMTQPCIDYAFVGDGDICFPEFLDKLEKGENVKTVASLVYRDLFGQVQKNPLAPRIDLDTLPCPDWGLFDERHLFRPYEGNIYKGSFYSQSRGCPMQCTYCVDPVMSEVTGGRAGYFRVQKPETTVAHLAELKEKFGATWFRFTDDTFLLPKIAHLEALRDSLKPMGIQFACSVMTNTITEEKVEVAKDFGCVAMSVGVEAGNKDIRETLKRRYTDEALIRSLGYVKKHGLKLNTFNLIGSPGETRENVFETIELNRKLDADSCNVYIVFPYPGTPIQIKSGLPIRDKQGEMLKVSSAKYLGLSEMGPDELQGLLDTFNLYLHAPNTLWPIVELAEQQNSAGKALHTLLFDFIGLIKSGADFDMTPLSTEESAKLGVHSSHGELPRCLYDLLQVGGAEQKRVVVRALRAYLQNSTHERSSCAETPIAVA